MKIPYFICSKGIFTNKKLTNDEKLVYVYLMSCAGENIPKAINISSKCSISEYTARQCLKALISKKLLHQDHDGTMTIDNTGGIK